MHQFGTETGLDAIALTIICWITGGMAAAALIMKAATVWCSTIETFRTKSVSKSCEGKGGEDKGEDRDWGVILVEIKRRSHHCIELKCLSHGQLSGSGLTASS